MTLRPRLYAFLAVLALLALGSMVILYISTPVGAGLSNDSVAYIAGARSILQHTGYSDIWLDSSLEPITHYPPLLSLSLSALGLLGIDPLRGARILNILLFGANTLLMGLLGWRVTRSRLSGVWLAALFMLNAALLRVHVFALSEPLFLFLCLLAFLFIDLYIAIIPRVFWLFLAGAAVGLAFLARYSALALLPVFLLALLLFKQDWRARFTSMTVFLFAAILPMGLWFLRNKLLAGNATNRVFQYHPLTSDNVSPGLYNLSQFLMPVEAWRSALLKSGTLSWLLLAFTLLLLAWLFSQTWRLLARRSADRPSVLAYTNVLYMFGYFGAILFSMSFFDASTKLQPRILAPLYVSGMILLVAAGAWLWRRWTFVKIGPILTGFLVVLTLALSAYGSLQAVSDFQSAGQGYASWKWHDSLIMASLQKLPSKTIIYTNTPPAVYLVTGRASRVLPTPVDPVDDHPRGDYQQNVAQMRTDLLSGEAVLALFNTSNLEDAPGMQDVTSVIADLKILQKAQGDTLYGKP